MENHPVVFALVALLCVIAFWPKIKNLVAGQQAAGAVAAVENALRPSAGASANNSDPQAAFAALLVVTKQLAANDVDAAKIATLTDPLAALIMHTPAPGSAK